MYANTMIQKVNYHLTQTCNMSCRHCFAANLPMKRLDWEDSARLVALLAKEGFEKINFAGGEPMLHPKLDHLIRAAKGAGMVTSIVTNGTRLNDKWLDYMSEYLDWIAVSVDSADSETHKLIGRAVNGLPVSTALYMEMSRLIRERGIRLKMNTVVNLHNHTEDMTRFVEEMKPERWKIMQALSVLGQNDRNASTFEITDAQFEAFCKRNQAVENIKVVLENNYMMTGSYVMVDPLGRFFDNTKGNHTYSQPILEVGVDTALKDVSVYPERFVSRGGLYE